MSTQLQYLPEKPRVLDIFCGAGGMSLGFRNAGCRILGGIDNYLHAVNTHHKNFPECQIKLPATDIEFIKIEKLALMPGDVDILIGGPPCQVFSQIGLGKMKSLGKNIAADPRNFLYKYYVNFLLYLQPRCFVLENVENLKRKSGIFLDLLDALEKGLPRQRQKYPGYKIKHVVLNALDYGVPQERKRLFIIGFRNDLNDVFTFSSLGHQDFL